MANENLRKAKEAKKDEFYTQLTDIVAEVDFLDSLDAPMPRKSDTGSHFHH